MTKRQSKYNLKAKRIINNMVQKLLTQGKGGKVTLSRNEKYFSFLFWVYFGGGGGGGGERFQMYHLALHMYVARQALFLLYFIHLHTLLAMLSKNSQCSAFLVKQT